jgi:colicin import membrane protein
MLGDWSPHFSRPPRRYLITCFCSHMAKLTKSPLRAKRPRAEVQEEFSAIREEVETAKRTAEPKREEMLRQQEAETRAGVEGISVDGVVQQVSGLGLEISKALSDLSAKLVEEVNRLASVRQAVELEQKELQRLHKIDIGATALDQLVQDYRQEKERQDAEIAAQRAAWEAESEQTEGERKEQEENLKKLRQREMDDYEYKKALERKRAQDKYDEEVRAVEKKNKERQETLEKDWSRREAELKEREEELARKESQEFAARLRSESEQAAAQATKAAEVNFEQQLLILRKDGEADKRVADLRIKGLEETISGQAAQIASLQKQLDQAKQQVQEIALQAIEGASGAKALAHINQIAMEQAKPRSPQS